MTQTVVPNHWRGLTHLFISQPNSSPTADDWRVFAEAFGPLGFTQMWGLYGVGTIRAYERQRSIFNPKFQPECLEMFMSLFAIVHLLFRPSVSEKQIATAERYIKRFTHLITSHHKGIVDTPNIHFLSHLPQDIRNHGPVYCFWCFSSERFNKVLKNINSNGHIHQLPATLVRMFQQYSHLQDLCAFDREPRESSASISAQTSRHLRETFEQWSEELSQTKEQQYAAQWNADEQDREGRDTFEAAQMVRLDDGRGSVMSSIESVRLKSYLGATQPWDFIEQHVDISTCVPQRTFVISTGIQVHSSARLGRKVFKNLFLPPGTMRMDTAKIHAAKDCFVEFRTTSSIHDVDHDRCTVALVCKIFSWSSSNIANDNQVSGNFMVCRNLQPFNYDGNDPYQWQRLLVAHSQVS